MNIFFTFEMQIDRERQRQLNSIHWFPHQIPLPSWDRAPASWNSVCASCVGDRAPRCGPWRTASRCVWAGSWRQERSGRETPHEGVCMSWAASSPCVIRRPRQVLGEQAREVVLMCERLEAPHYRTRARSAGRILPQPWRGLRWSSWVDSFPQNYRKSVFDEIKKKKKTYEQK